MTQPYPYLALADALDTITIMAGSATPGDVTLNRRLWAPAVASLRPNQIGGQGPYQEVIEEFDLNITGSTVAAAYAVLERLNQLLDRAERWARAEYLASTYSGVQLRYSPQGSTSSSTANYLRCIVLGRAPGDTTRAPVELPPTFTESGITRAALGVRLRLWRRGRWLAPLSTFYGSDATPNGSVMTVSGIPAHSTMSPVSTLTLSGFNSTTTPTISAGYLCVGAMTSDVIRRELMSGATAPGYTTVNDSGNLPRGGTNVLRYTPTGTAPASSGWTAAVDAESDSPVAVLAVVRNNASDDGHVFQLRVDLRGYGATVSTPYVPVTLPVTATPAPQVVRLGIVRHPTRIQQVRVTCSVDSLTFNPTLDIDAIYLVALHNQASRVIQHAAIDLSGLPGGTAAQIEIAVQPDARLTPRMTAGSSGYAVPVTYYDPIDLETLGATYTLCWVSTRANYWRFTTSSGGVSVLSLTALMRRNLAWLGPQ